MKRPDDRDAAGPEDVGAPSPEARLAAWAAAAGLHRGRMIAYSKSGYLRRRPGHYAVFNANIVDGKGRSLWQGDLDLTDDETALATVVRAFGEPLHVFHEDDAPCDAEDPQGTGLAVISILPTGEVRVNDAALPPIRRGEDGRLVPDRSGGSDIGRRAQP